MFTGAVLLMRSLNLQIVVDVAANGGVCILRVIFSLCPFGGNERVFKQIAIVCSSKQVLISFQHWFQTPKQDFVNTSCVCVQRKITNAKGYWCR